MEIEIMHLRFSQQTTNLNIIFGWILCPMYFWTENGFCKIMSRDYDSRSKSSHGPKNPSQENIGFLTAKSNLSEKKCYSYYWIKEMPVK
jgi:hypothetical protein